MRLRIPLLFVAMLLAPSAFAQEQAFANRATELKDRAAADARTVSAIAEGAPLKVLERAGGWTRVEAAGQQGWVRVFHLRFPATVQAGVESGGVMGNVTSALGFGRERSKSTTLATTGVRGLTPEDLRNSRPDPEALRLLHSFRADTASAERFAREGRLAAVSISYDEARR
jgi:SH3 domain-containing protein